MSAAGHYAEKALELQEKLEAAEARYHTDVDGAISERLIAERRVAKLEAELAAIGPEKTICTKCNAYYRYIAGTHSIEFCFACIEEATQNDWEYKYDDTHNDLSVAEGELYETKKDLDDLREDTNEERAKVVKMLEGWDSIIAAWASDPRWFVTAGPIHRELQAFLHPKTKKSGIDVSQVSGVPLATSDPGDLQSDVPSVAGAPSRPGVAGSPGFTAPTECICDKCGLRHGGPLPAEGEKPF